MKGFTVGVTVYRSGGLTERSQLTCAASDRFEAVAVQFDSNGSGRTGSLFMAPSLGVTRREWVPYRQSLGLDACIYAVTLPDGVDPVCAPVPAYDFFAAYGDEGSVEDYLTERKALSDLVFEDYGQYEVLLPYDEAVGSEWVLIECVADCEAHLPEAAAGNTRTEISTDA